MTLEQMKAQLGMESVPEVFESLYEQVKDTWQDRAALILSDAFITDVIEKSGQMTAYVEQILAGAKGVRENPAMCLLVCVLEAYMELDTKPDNSYIAPEGEGVAYDMLHLFPTMPAILKAAENFRKRNVPADVIANTMKIYTEVFDMTTHVYGRPFQLNQIIHIHNGSPYRKIVSSPSKISSRRHFAKSGVSSGRYASMAAASCMGFREGF